jgi:predicted RNA-binding Zn-ribbon protein involved in translation (DUF1610 family)
MNRILILLVAVLALAGCQSAPKSTEQAADPNAPVLIASLTDQTKVWECPKCGMMFDRAGMCSMDPEVALVETNVSYICPADNKPVEKAGKCDRCPMNARVDKVAVAAATPSGH